MSNSKKMILLKSSDGETFELEETAARQSQTIANMIEDDCADDGIPLPNVNSKILAKVIEYCKKHVDGGSASEEDIKNWDADLIKEIDQATLFELLLAANFLNIKSLLDLTCQAAADMIKDWMPEQVRTIFNVENDYTPEEEAEVRRENDWAFH